MSVRHPQTEEQELLVEAVRTLAREKIAPHAAEVDKKAEFPWDAVQLLRDNDVFALAFKPEYGGTGTGYLTFLRAVEELCWADATVGLVLSVQALGATAIDLAGSEEQKSRYLPKWASGEWIGAYALTEAGSGSDAQAMRTSYRREGDEWVIEGSKRFITNAGVAHTYVVFAKSRRRDLGVHGRAGRSRVLGVAGSSPRWASRARPRASCSSTAAGFLPAR